MGINHIVLLIIPTIALEKCSSVFQGTFQEFSDEKKKYLQLDEK